MTITTNVLSFVLLALLSAKAGVALQCYMCNGRLDQNLDCANNWENVLTTRCLPENICTTYVLQEPGGKVLYRGCFRKNVCAILENQYAKNPSISLESCETCSEELCNSANSLIVSIILTFLALLLLLL